MKLFILVLILVANELTAEEIAISPKTKTSVNITKEKVFEIDAAYAPTPAPIYEDSSSSEEDPNINVTIPKANLSNHETNVTSTEMPRMLRDKPFHPSPQVPFFENNPNPVVPVLPEAKHNFYNQLVQSKPLKFDHNEEKNPEHLRVIKAKDRPYLFDNEKNLGFQSYPTVKSYSVTDYKRPHFDHPIFPPFHHHHPPHHLDDMRHHPEHHDYPVTSPWKKIIHFVTTFLPIGLFLTALTPTILNITPVNTTIEQPNRARAVNVDESLLDLLEGRSDDVTGCHQTRLLCAAAAKGRLPTASNLQKSLWMIANQAHEESRGPKEFSVLFKAIKNNKCSELKCKKDVQENNLEKIQQGKH